MGNTDHPWGNLEGRENFDWNTSERRPYNLVFDSGGNVYLYSCLIAYNKYSLKQNIFRTLWTLVITRSFVYINYYIKNKI